MSKVQFHKFEKDKREKILEGFVAIGGLAQIGIGVVLIFQLIAYIDSNKLTKRSFELNRKAVILSHTPWLSLTRVDVKITGEQQMTISFFVENHSDYPVFKMKSVQYFYEDTAELPKDDPGLLLMNSRASNDTIMPHDERSFVNADNNANAEKAVKGFYNNRFSLKIFIQYEDVFHRKILFVNTLRANAQSPVVWRVIDSHIDGIDNFDVKGL